MIAVYSVGFTWMKYKEGYMKVLGFGCTFEPAPLKYELADGSRCRHSDSLCILASGV